MATTMLTLACPCCNREEGLTVKVLRTGEGWWVSRMSQACRCDVYAAWDSVWWEARRRVGKRLESEMRQRGQEHSAERWD